MPADDLSASATRTLSEIPFRRDASGALSPDVIAIGVTIAAAIALTLWWFGRHSKKPLWRLRASRAPAALELMATLQLGPQVKLHVVRWNASELLIACHPQTLTVLPPPVSSTQELGAQHTHAKVFNDPALDERLVR